jgi:hypothetical protein
MNEGWNYVRLLFTYAYIQIGWTRRAWANSNF